MLMFTANTLLFASIAWAATTLPRQRDQDRLRLSSLPTLLDVTLEELTDGLSTRLFTSVDLVNVYSARIGEVNSRLNAVTELNPDALQIAADLDAERRSGRTRGPLHGIPILIKNNIATADQMNNTAGSFALLGAKVPSDSTIARKLRHAGAIILGKANLSQWANYRSYNSNNGWSAHGGQVYGAYYPYQDPCGSSSGSGVASSLGLSFASIGTETDGSIVCPASRNNIVGIKPTVGLTSRHLVIPISEHQDSIGPMARTVKDAAYILQAIAGVDQADNYTSAIPNGGELPNYVAACIKSSLEGARIGVPRNAIEVLRTPDEAADMNEFEIAVNVIRSAGATVVDPANFTAAAEFKDADAETKTLNADFLVNLASYFSQLTYNPENISDLRSLREFTHVFPLEEYPSRDTGPWDDALDSQGWNNTDPRFWPTYQQSMYYGAEGGLLGALERNNLDAIVMPTAFASSWAAVIGAPIITVPLGCHPDNTTVILNKRGNLVDSGPRIPIGLSFLGAKWSEEKLIGLAYAFEQQTNARRKVKPYLLPTKELKDLVGL